MPKPTDEAQRPFDKARDIHRKATDTDSTDPALMHEAIKGYELAARAGHWKAARNLATIYTVCVDSGSIGSDPTIKPNASKAIEQVRRLIDMNVATGFNLMSVYAAQGWGVKQDPVASLMYFRKAADLGLPEAQRRLGNKFGLEFKQLPDGQREQMWVLGRKMLACAAKQGSRQAAFELATDYKSGSNNYPYSLFYYQQGGKMGDATCLYVLYKWFKEGQHGYAIDLSRAERYNEYSRRADAREGPFPDLDRELPLPPPPEGGSYPAPETGWPNAWTPLK